MTSAIGCDCSDKHPWVVACLHGDDSFVATLRDYQHPEYLKAYEYVPDEDEEWDYRRFEVHGGYEYGPYVQGYRGDDLKAAMDSLFKIKDELAR